MGLFPTIDDGVCNPSTHHLALLVRHDCEIMISAIQKSWVFLVPYGQSNLGDFKPEFTTTVLRNPGATVNIPDVTGEPSLSGVRILVVEDSWHVALAMTSLAENAGMVLAGPAATVAEAERLLAMQTPDVAVVDIYLRDEMVYKLIDRLHADGVPIVIASGYEVLASWKSKVVAILTKPFRADDLLVHLRRIIADRTAVSQRGKL